MNPGDLESIPGQLALPGMPPPAEAGHGQLTLPGLEFPGADGRGADDSELAAVGAELRALDDGGTRMAAAIRGALDMLLDGQHTGRYRWDQLHKTENLIPNQGPQVRKGTAASLPAGMTLQADAQSRYRVVGDALTIVCVNDQQPRSVYIDINHWYALARADDGKPDKPEHAAILRKLLAEVDAGRLVVPLSSVTYTELTENPRDQLRQPAAGVMLKLSRLATIAPAQKIVDEELARELNRRFGRPAFPIKVPKLGRGVGFAFGMPGRVKATGFTDAERERIEAQMGKTIADLELEVNAQFEYWLLATPRSLRNRIPGFEPVVTRADAAAELAEIQIMVDTLHSAKEIATRPMDGVAARQLCRDIFDNFTQALKSDGFVNGSPMHTSGELTDFLEHLPTQRVATSLKYHYVKQTATTWKINHLRDIAALSVAIPYTDAVVTDADIWDVATHRAHLDDEFGTPIFKSLTDLAAHLGL